MLKFAANLSMMYTEHAFLDRYAAAAADGQGQIRYGYQCAHCTPLMRGSKRSRTASPSRLIPSSASAMARPGRMER